MKMKLPWIYLVQESTALFDLLQSKVTDNNSISLAQFEYAVFFEENYEEEIASGNELIFVN